MSRVFKDFDGYLNTTDLAAAFQVRTETVNRWTKQGVIPPPAMRVNGLRYWKTGIIEQMREIFSKDAEKPARGGRFKSQGSN